MGKKREREERKGKKREREEKKSSLWKKGCTLLSLDAARCLVVAQTQWQRAAKKPKMVKVSSQASGGASAVAESGQETRNGGGVFFSGERWRKRGQETKNASWRTCLQRKTL